MSYISAEGLPATYSQATITNAGSTETLLINTNSVQVVAGSDLYLGSLGDATQLTLAPGLVTSNTPFEVSNNGAIMSLGTTNAGSVLATTSTILELNVAPSNGAAPQPVVAVADALILHMLLYILLLMLFILLLLYQVSTLLDIHTKLFQELLAYL